MELSSQIGQTEAADLVAGLHDTAHGRIRPLDDIRGGSQPNTPNKAGSSADAAASLKLPSTDRPAGPNELRERAEALYEELGGDLCICQRDDVPHWCERCQRSIDLIQSAFQRLPAPPARE